MKRQLPADGATILEAAEKRFFEATSPNLPLEERRRVAQYFVGLGLIGDTESARIANLQAADPKSADDLADALDFGGAMLWDGVTDLLTALAVPQAFRQHHGRLIEGLRALADIDRTGADYLRRYGNMEGYTTGESERRAAFSKIQSAITGIVASADSYFPPGRAADILSQSPG